MDIIFQSKGDFNEVTKWLNKVANAQPTTALNKIASDGGRSLSNNTPRDTGATALGWTAEVTRQGKNYEIAWNNNAHPGLSVNIARIIDQGYTTGTGGYVPPRPYIKKSMDGVWKDAGDRIFKEMTK